MPRLLLFAPCEKVIIDQNNNPTLVSILQEWQADRQVLPEKAIAPHRWDIFTLWYRLESDTDRIFVQTCELVTPSGEKAIASDMEFRMTATTHRNTMGIMGLPINPGKYELSLYLHEKGAEKDRERVAVFPLLVTAQAS